MELQILSTELKSNVLLLTISRPKALNALNSQFFKELNYVLDTYSDNRDVSVMIITGDGKAFVAGADIQEMHGMTELEGKEFALIGQKTFDRLENLPFPTIAAVNGFALGGGCELSMACDIRIASEYAKFGQPEVNLGLIPGYAGTQRLSRLIGLSNALYLLYTADIIDAQQALKFGLVQKVVSADDLLPECEKIALKIASKGPKAIKKVKSVTRAGFEMNFDDALKLEAEEFGKLFNDEAQEGTAAFLEKRKPNWNN